MSYLSFQDPKLIKICCQDNLTLCFAKIKINKSSNLEKFIKLNFLLLLCTWIKVTSLYKSEIKKIDDR